MSYIVNSREIHTTLLKIYLTILYRILINEVGVGRVKKNPIFETNFNSISSEKEIILEIVRITANWTNIYSIFISDLKANSKRYSLEIFNDWN